jgi:GlcNAc-P-P-Und epimerase
LSPHLDNLGQSKREAAEKLVRGRLADGLLAGRRVLITGGSGFIGTHLVRELRDAGATVVNFDIAPPKLAEHEPHWIQGDVLAESRLREVIAGFSPTDIAHLAARTDTLGSSFADYDVNVQGTRNVLRAIGRELSAPRMILVSSQFVVGPGEMPVRDDEYRPYTVYGMSKVAAEQLLRGDRYPGAWTIVRPTNIWGPWHPRYPREFWRVLSKRLYVHPGRRPVTRSYGYVRNVTHQILAILTLPSHKVTRRTLYLGDRPIDLLQWVDAFAQALTGRPPIVAPRVVVFGAALVGELLLQLGASAPLFLSRYRSMTEDYPTPMEPTFSLLGESPIRLMEGVAETVDWLKSRHSISTSVRSLSGAWPRELPTPSSAGNRPDPSDRGYFKWTRAGREVR